MEVVAEGITAAADAGEPLLIAAVRVSPQAVDERRVFENDTGRRSSVAVQS